MSSRSQNRRRKAIRQATQADEITSLAKAAGLSVTINRCERGKNPFLHVMFKTVAGVRLLDYWPTTGTMWDPITGERHKAPTADCAVVRAMAIQFQLKDGRSTR